MTVYRDDVEVAAARGGENLRLRLNGIDEDDIAAGFVICSRNVPVPCVTYFDAQLQILDLLEHKVPRPTFPFSPRSCAAALALPHLLFAPRSNAAALAATRSCSWDVQHQRGVASLNQAPRCRGHLPRVTPRWPHGCGLPTVIIEYSQSCGAPCWAASCASMRCSSGVGGADPCSNRQCHPRTALGCL